MAENDSNKKSKLESTLESLLKLKSSEVDSLKSELLNLSSDLDLLLSQSQEEVQALRSLFQGLVPTKLPRIEGFEFSRKFSYGTEKGGDFFDLFPHGQNQSPKSSWSLFISSCERYATSAQIMGQMITLSPLFSSGNGSAQDHVRQLFSSLTELQATDRFSLFYAIINRSTLTLDFYCQGEIVGFVVQPGDTPLVSQISAKNPTQNDWGHVVVETAAMKLSAGTRVCLFSPGVLKVLDAPKLGKLCRDMAAAPIHDLRNEINFQLEKISGKKQPDRDQIVFLFDINKNVLSVA